MEKKWDTVIPADLKSLFVSGTYMSCWSQKGYDTQSYIFTCYFIWVWSLVSYCMGMTRTEDVSAQGAEWWFPRERTVGELVNGSLMKLEANNVRAHFKF
jgi:hypothetical protein